LLEVFKDGLYAVFSVEEGESKLGQSRTFKQMVSGLLGFITNTAEGGFHRASTSLKMCSSRHMSGKKLVDSANFRSFPMWVLKPGPFFNLTLPI